MLRHFEAVETGGAGHHHIHRVLFGRDQIARRQRNGKIKICVVRGGCSAAGPIVNFFEFDVEGATDGLHGLIILFSHPMQRTARIIGNFQENSLLFHWLLQRIRPFAAGGAAFLYLLCVFSKMFRTDFKSFVRGGNRDNFPFKNILGAMSTSPNKSPDFSL